MNKDWRYYRDRRDEFRAAHRIADQDDMIRLGSWLLERFPGLGVLV